MTAEVRVGDLEVTFTKRDGERVTALQGVNLELEPGDFVSIVGPSGCGKTTLLRVIAGLQRPTRGAALVDEREVTKPRRDTCLMFQSPTLLPWLTVLNNCLLPTTLRRRPTEADVDTATNLLERTGLAGFHGSLPHELSGGMQQRVALCRALTAKPNLLLLDEPFGALDAMTREQMNLDLNRLWLEDEVTTLLITHSISEAVFLSQRVVVMSSRPGQIVDVVEVPLPRRRGVSVMESEEYMKTCGRIRAYFTRESQTVASEHVYQ